jgi:hypothetical protein
MKLTRIQLRDLFWLMLVVGLGLTWWLDRSRIQNRSEMYASQVAGLQRLVNERSGFTIRSLAFEGSDQEYIAALRKPKSEETFYEQTRSLSEADEGLIQATVPQIIALLNDPDDEVRRRSAIALRFLHELSPAKVAPSAATSVDGLIPLLDDTNTTVVVETIITLGSLGPAARPALERLQRRAADDEDFYAARAAMAVHEIDPSVNIGPRLVELVKQKHPDWLTIAFYLPRYVPADEAKELLTAMYDSSDNKSDRQRLVNALNQVEP